MKTTFLFLFFVTVLNSLFAQERVYNNNYRDYSNFKQGIYVQKSIDTSDDYDCLPILKSNRDLGKERVFIKPLGKRIVLFDDYKRTTRNAVRQLIQTTPVEVDSTFYNWIYKKDTTKQWSYPTYDIWNRVIIDSTAYYLDYDLHDYVSIVDLKEVNQKLYIIGQNDGYDYAYHLGYPEHFFFIFTDENGKEIHETDLFDITVGEEYGMLEFFFKKKWNDKTKTYEMQLFNQSDESKKLNFTWKNNQFREVM